MRAGFGSPRHLVHYARGHQWLPPSCCWCRNSERHFAADLGRLGSLMVWRDAAAGTWSAFVPGTQRTGFITAAAAQAAALRLAGRCRRLVKALAADDGANHRIAGESLGIVDVFVA